MKKLLLLLFIPIVYYGQNPIILKNGKIKSGYEIEKPLGLNVTLSYNSFFKSYILNYTDIDGNRNELKFIWEPSYKGGTVQRAYGHLKYNNKEFQIHFEKGTETSKLKFEKGKNGEDKLTYKKGTEKDDTVKFIEEKDSYPKSYIIYDFTKVNYENYKEEK